jgi:nitroreductase
MNDVARTIGRVPTLPADTVPVGAAWSVDPLGPALTACLNAAAAAPSVHNTQPWRFRLRPNRVDLMLDPDRRLYAIDPDGREAYISIGAALLNLRIAILAAGRVPIMLLQPEHDEPDLLASVMIGGTHRPDATVRSLASAIDKRRTNRRPFRDIEVRDEVIDQLAAAARVEGAALVAADPITRTALLGLIRTAYDRQQEDPGYVAELGRWAHTDAGRRDGVPARSFGPIDDGGVLPIRDFGLAQPTVLRRHARFESAPTIVAIYTNGDTPLYWLRAGLAMERVLLTATVRGVANTPMTAPTEVPEIGSLLSSPGYPRTVQVILRLGYGDLCPATPRRPLGDVIAIDAPAAAG